MVDCVGAMISRLLYSRKLTNTLKTDAADRPKRRAIAQFILGESGVQSSLLLLKVQAKHRTNSTVLKYNPNNVHVIMTLVIKISKVGAVQPKDVLILRFYNVQLKLYNQAVRDFSLDRRKSHTGKIEISKIDSTQGLQEDLIIRNIITSGQLEFMSQRNHVNVGVVNC